ncbi:MAG: DNA polymerase IV [Acidobacteria bacterium]|nr:DNA polymerase IV [Acidobacteriota bacterium]
MPNQQSARTILHLDMDAFYAAVEIREDPSLGGKPLIIGHRGRRGVVSTCSYEARKFGVHSAMPSLTAERLCPQAVWLPGRMSLYVEVSRQIRTMLNDVTPLVEPLSIDEAFLDLTGIAKDLHEGGRIARRLKERIRREQRLTASVGVAPNKFLAKIASDLEKPDGLVVFHQEEVPTRLHPLPVERLWGVGPKSAQRLHELGITTVGDVLKTALEKLRAKVGDSLADHLRSLAKGEDERPVEGEREAKSISEERTYGSDLRDPDLIDRALLERCEGVARQLRKGNWVAGTIHLKVRTGDFKTWTRSKALKESTDLPEVIVAAARELFARRIRLQGKGVRLLGVGVSSLSPAGAGQVSMFPDPAGEKAHRLAAAADALRDRFGEEAVTRARLLRRPKGKKDKAPPEASSLPSVD